MENTKITSHQLFAMTAIYSCGTSIIIVSAGLAGLAKQDAWISSIITIFFGLFFVWMYAYLGSLYPDKSYIDIIRLVFGKLLGNVISAAFVFICLLDVPQITWYVGNFVRSQYLNETPINSIYALMIIALVIALLFGIEAIARSSEFFILIVSFMIILMVIMVSPNAKVDNILPVLEKGIVPVLKGSLLLSSYMTWPLIVLNMIYPSHFNHIKNARKSLFLGYLWGSTIIFFCNIMAILVLGSSIAASSQYPTYLLAKQINFGMVFNRVEAIVSVTWIVTCFFKTLIYFYAGVIGLSQLLGLKDYRKIVLPLGLIALVFVDVVYPNGNYEAEWDSTVWILWIGTFGVILPIVLLVVSRIKLRQ